MKSSNVVRIIYDILFQTVTSFAHEGKRVIKSTAPTLDFLWYPCNILLLFVKFAVPLAQAWAEKNVSNLGYEEFQSIPLLQVS